MILEKRCITFIWNLFNGSHELHKTIVKNCFYKKGSTLAEYIKYLMYKYDITINDWHQSLNYVIKKSMHMTMTVPIVMIHVLQTGAPNSAKFRGVAEGHPRFDKGGGGAIIFYFLCIKNRTF